MVTRTLLAIGLLLALGGNVAQESCPAPLWTVDLVSKYHLDVEALRPGQWWKYSHGIAYTSPNTLVVSEVIENKAVTGLERRQPRGGGGRFTFRALFLDARNGKEVRELDWATPSVSEGGSELHATHDGRFVVRTGRVLRLYSPGFQQIASRSLPIDGSPSNDIYAFIEVVPPGRLLFLEEHSSNKGEKRLLDADTLQPIQNPTPADVALWPDAGRYFPELVRSQPRHLTILGYSEKGKHIHDCTFAVFVSVPRRSTVPGGCKKLDLFLPDGRPWWHLEFRNEVDFLGISGNTLAVDLDHWPWDPLDLGLPPKPLRIVVYNVAQKAEECSLDLRKLRKDETYDFAVSSDGLLAVRMGNQLSVYKP